MGLSPGDPVICCHACRARVSWYLEAKEYRPNLNNYQSIQRHARSRPRTR